MSLLGKILVVLNLLGAAGLVYVATADYAKRQAWAHNYVRTELLLTGLPLDENELDSSNQPSVNRLSENDYSEMFRSAGGVPVRTQVEEFDNLRSQLANRIASAEQDSVRLANLLARLMLPLTDSYVEREFFLSVRDNCVDNQTFEHLRNRCLESFRQAVSGPAPSNLSVHQAFRAAFHAQPGPPAELFVTRLLKSIPQDRQQAANVNVALVFGQAATAQLNELKARYESLLSEAAGQSPDAAAPGKTPDAASRKAAIARLLFGFALPLSELEIASDSGNPADKQLLMGLSPAEYHKRLTQTETYKQRINRMLVVCGIRGTLRAIGERSSGLRRLNDYAQNLLAVEQQQFVNDYRFRLSVIREVANLVGHEQNLRTENQERLLGYETIAKERMAEIKQLQEEYGQLRSSSDQEMTRLRQLSQAVLDLRLQIRDAIETNERGEERIRALENRIREQDQSKDN